MCTHCYKLASEEARHQILTLLKKGPHTVGELTERLHVKQPTVTHHLKLLSKAGLVAMEKKGQQHLFTLNKKSECFSDCGLLKGLVE